LLILPRVVILNDPSELHQSVRLPLPLEYLPPNEVEPARWGRNRFGGRWPSRSPQSCCPYLLPRSGLSIRRLESRTSPTASRISPPRHHARPTAHQTFPGSGHRADRRLRSSRAPSTSRRRW